MIAGQLFQLVFFIIFASVIVNAIFPNSEIILASRIYPACFALGVVVAYGSVTLQALRKRTAEAGDFLMTGITIAFSRPSVRPRTRSFTGSPTRLGG